MIYTANPVPGNRVTKKSGPWPGRSGETGFQDAQKGTSSAASRETGSGALSRS